MAGIDSQNQVQELLGLLGKRMWTILLPVLYLGTLGVVLATFLPRKYESETTINIKPTRIEDEGRVSRDAPQTDTQREIPNAENQIKQPKRINEIIQANSVDWPEFAQLDTGGRQELIASIAKNISVAVLANPNEKNQGSTFIDVSYLDTVPRRAPKFLRELSKRWVEDVYDAEVTQQRNIEQISRDQVAETDREIQRVAEEIQQIEDQEGITVLAVTDQRSARETDPVQTRPDELLEQRLAIEDSLESAQTALATAQELYAVIEPMVQGPEPSIPESYLSQLQGIQLQISMWEGQLKGLKNASPERTKFERQIEDAEQRMLDLQELFEDNQPEAALVQNPERLALANKINNLEIEIARSERDLELVQEQYLAAVARRSSRIDALRQLRALEAERVELVEQRSEQRADLYGAQKNVRFYEELPKPYEITKEPTLPSGPSWPNVPLVVGFSIVAGLALGLGLAFLLEFAQPGFRGSSEVSRGLGLPILGIVNEITTRSVRRRRRLTQVAVGLSTFVLLGSLGWVTWAWLNDPRLLGTDFARFLDDLHEKLR